MEKHEVVGSSRQPRTAESSTAREQSREASTETLPSESTVGGSALSELDDGSRPQLPSRKVTLELMGNMQKSPTQSLRVPRKASRPQLQSMATTALSLADAETHLRSDGSPRTPARSLHSMSSRRSLHPDTPSRRDRGYTTSEADETMSIRSFVPTAGGSADAESILGDLLLTDQRSPGWRFLTEQGDKQRDVDVVPFDVGEPTADFNREFDEIPDVAPDSSNEGLPLTRTLYCKTKII